MSTYDSTITCCICLRANNDLVGIKVSAAEANCEEDSKVTYKEKLEYIAPEQDWHDHFCICKECQGLINATYRFRNLCFKFTLDRNQIVLIQKKVEQIDDFHIPGFDDDFFDEKEVKFEIKSEKIGKTKGKLHKKKKKTEVICYHCEKQFKSKRNLSFHISLVHGLSCHRCQDIFHGSKLVEKHIKEKHPFLRKRKIAEIYQHKFQCEFCGEYFPLRKTILEHYEEIHQIPNKEAKPYACIYCPKRFGTSANLIQHKHAHEGVRPHICSFCGKSFISKADILSHEQIHLNERKYKCTFENCKKAFNTSKNLQTHILNMHTDRSKWKYTCEFCEKKFSQKSNYMEHKRRHTGIRDFMCQICKKTFSTKSELTRHIKYHSNLRPHKCTECDKEYREKRALITHLLNIHKIGTPRNETDKKYACHICNVTFFENYKLARHLRTHSDIKPFHCADCNKRFIDKSYLNHHLKTVHNVVETLKIEFTTFDEYYTVATI